MLHDQSAMNEASEAMQQNLHALIVLLRDGFLRKVVSINDTLERLASEKGTGCCISSDHAEVKSYIYGTNHYLARYLTVNNVNSSAQARDNKQQAMLDYKSVIEATFPEHNPIKETKKLITKFRKMDDARRNNKGVADSLRAVNNYYTKPNRPQISINAISELSDEKITALKNDAAKKLETAVKALSTYNETVNSINTNLAEMGIERRLDMDGTNLRDVNADFEHYQSIQGANQASSNEAETPYVVEPIVVNTLAYVLGEIQYLIDQIANKEIDNQCHHCDILSAKIGQCFRDIEEKIQLLDAPLLNDSIRETIRTRNKGIL